MVSIGVEYDKIGDRDNLASLPYGAGIPQAVVDLTHRGARSTTPRRWSAASSALDAEGRKPACVIMEAAMMNLGVVLPEPGYLEAVREITAAPRHRADLRRGQDRPVHRAPAARPSASACVPDMVTLAKALGGGLPTGAIGGTEEVMSVVEDGSVYQVGTYNGNPLGMAATRANLARGADARRLRAPRPPQRPASSRGCDGRHRRSTTCPGYAVGVGSKGCVTFSPDEDRRLRDVQGQPGRRARRARVAVQHEPRHLHDAGPRGGLRARHPLRGADRGRHRRRRGNPP